MKMKMKILIWRTILKHVDHWKNLKLGEARRVDVETRFDFFWVSLEGGLPGLMLKLNNPPNPLPRLPKLKNLTINFRQAVGGSAFVLGLKEKNQLEIFQTLCLDVINAGEAGTDISNALSRTIQRTRRWYHLLHGGKNQGLSVEDQRGLIGELAFLRDLTNELGPETAIEAWTGPTGSSKDFELIGTCIEVKTRRTAAKPFISISSADQLEDVEGCILCLRVANVTSAVLPEGKSLHDHVQMTEKLFIRSGNSFETWEEMLYATGYDPENDYDDRRWLLGTVTNYDVKDNFPRIVSPLATGLKDIRYSISLNECEAFKLDIELIDLIRRGLNYE